MSGRIREVEAFFDCSCVWAYLAFAHIRRRFAGASGVRVRWRPVLAQQVFAAVNPSAGATQSEAKLRQVGTDLAAWARYLGLPLTPSAAAADSTTCMVACIAADRWGKLEAFAWAMLDLAWAQGRDIADGNVLRAAWQACGLPRSAFDEAIAWPAFREELQANGRELMARGGFGVPTFFLGDDMYFGNDAVPLLQQALELRQKLDHRAEP